MAFEPPMLAAWRLAKALGCNILPTGIESRAPRLDGWSGLAIPNAHRLTAVTLTKWKNAELEDLARGREDVAWALLPGSGRIAVLDSDSEEWTGRLIERQPTPLVVTSPTPGRAHLYYRWPDGIDLASRDAIAGPSTYELKARGKTIHAPGSLHKSRKGRYMCSLLPDEIVVGLRERLPVLDLALVEEDARSRPGRPERRLAFDIDRWSTDGSGERRWLALLPKVPPATQGGRQTKLWWLACRAADLGVTVPFARPGLVAWALECVPPLSETEAVDALLRAYRSRHSAIGSDLAPAVDIVVDL